MALQVLPQVNLQSIVSFITLQCDQMRYLAQLYTIILFRTIYFVSVDEIADKPFDPLVYGIRMPDTQ